MRDEPMVDITKACPSICIEMRYATERNLAGKVIYPLGRARSSARRGQAPREDAGRTAQGWASLKIWGMAYRPAWAAERRRWKALPDTEHLANPARGGSYHSWGTTVDVTLVDLQGHEQKMASDFDDFSLAAKSAYVGTDAGIAARMKLLRTAMLNAGFNGIRDERGTSPPRMPGSSPWWTWPSRTAGTNNPESSKDFRLIHFFVAVHPLLFGRKTTK